MHVLLGMCYLRYRTGAEMFVRETALSLHARGHRVSVYAPIMDEMVDDLRAKGIRCVTQLAALTGQPDVLIGNTHDETVAILDHFPRLRAISICHDRTAAHGMPPRSPRVLKYVAVDTYCLERLVAEHEIPKDRTTVIPNGVDILRFKPRPPLPGRPGSAALFSNHATDGRETRTIRSVCAERQIGLTVIGSGMKNHAPRPEDLLPQFDLVFAKGRCAIEAMAVGCAVIVMSEQMDMPGLAGIVSPDNMREWRARNFGRSLLVKPVDEASLHAAIAAYDPARAMEVQAFIRGNCTLEQTVDALESLALPLAKTWIGRLVDAAEAAKRAVRRLPATTGSSSVIARIEDPETSGNAPLRLSSFIRPHASKTAARAPMPIIVGSPRSGTTLLRLMLDSHPGMAIPPETGFLTIGRDLAFVEKDPRRHFAQSLIDFPPDAPGWSDFQIPGEEFAAKIAALEPFTVADGFRCFYRLYAERFGKARWGDKTPLYLLSMPMIEDLLPEAHFIHIVRDGRDCAASLRSRFFSPGHAIAVQAEYWRTNVLTGRNEGAKRKRYIEVRYEDLLRNPGDVLASVCEFVELPFHARMLDYYKYAPQRIGEHRGRVRSDGTILITQQERHAQQELTLSPPDVGRIGAWRRQLSRNEARDFEAIAGDALFRFGYPIGNGADEPAR